MLRALWLARLVLLMSAAGIRSALVALTVIGGLTCYLVEGAGIVLALFLFLVALMSRTLCEKKSASQRSD